MRRELTAIFLAFFLIFGICTCGSNTPAEPSASPSADVSEQTSLQETTPAETEPTLDAPVKDYNGYAYRILAADVDIGMVFSEEMTGNSVNDAVFQSNTAVEEKYNIVLKQEKLGSWSDAAAIRTKIQGGGDEFDVGVCHDVTSGNLSLEGLFLNLYKVPYIDLSKPWWPAFTTDQLTVNGQMYVFSNYIGYNGLRGTKNMYVNLDKLKDLKIASPYEMVRKGTWTLDNVIDLTKNVYTDVNGDGNADRDDFYGFAFTGLFYGWLENFNIEAYRHSEDNKTVYLALKTERTAELVDKIKGWLNGGNPGVYYRSSHKSLYVPEAYPLIFADGNCLLTYGSLYVLIENLENSSVTYGILPMPKYDEAQADYIGVCYDSPMWIPVSVKDAERSGIITEAMSYEGYKTILPAYREVALKQRYAQDPDSAEMLDIIFKNRWLSFSYIYGTSASFQNILNKLVPSDTLEFASYYASNEPAQQQIVDNINAFFAGK